LYKSFIKGKYIFLLGSYYLCLRFGWQLLNILETHIDESAKKILSNFSLVRDELATELNVVVDQSNLSQESSKLKIVISHAEDVLIAEVSNHGLISACNLF